MSATRTAALDTLYSVSVEHNNAKDVYVQIALEATTETKGGTIGRFVLVATTAPRSYDYEGATIEVMEHDGIRWVLVNTLRAFDQTTRYSSGLYANCRSIDPTTEGVLAVLWRKLFAGGAA
jgi:hypothetical protein